MKKDPPPPSVLRYGTDFLAALLTGAAIGYGLDTFFQTKPWLIIVFSIFGFAAGLKNISSAFQNKED